MGLKAMSFHLVVVGLFFIGTGLSCRTPNGLTTVRQVTKPNKVRML